MTKAGETRPKWFGRIKVTGLRVFAVAFAALLLAGASVGIANFNAGSTRFAWMSVGFSSAAVVLSIVALAVPRKE